jgi:hypothetical protein
LQAPAVHVQDALQVSVSRPQRVPQAIERESPGVHTPVSPVQTLKSLHVPDALHTRICEPHLPHGLLSDAPGVHPGDAQAPKLPQVHAALHVRVFTSEPLHPAADVSTLPATHSPCAHAPGTHVQASEQVT